jgi:hypothetical protein
MIAITQGQSRPSLQFGEMNRVGASAMTVTQWMDLTLLHEIAHSFGLGHPGTNDVNDAAGFNKGIWQFCFQ